MHLLEQSIKENDDGSGYARMAFFMSMFTDELADELAELDPLKVQVFLFQIGEVIAWIGHGDNTRLPETVREFAEKINSSANVDSESGSHIQLDSGTG